MIILDATTRSLEAVLAGAVTTNQLVVVTGYVDVTITTYIAGSSNTITNNTTGVTILAAPGASTQRQLKFLSVFNNDTAAATVTIRYNDNTTLRTLAKVSLGVSDTLQYTDGEGWRVLSESSDSGSVIDSDNIFLYELPGIMLLMGG